MKSILPLLFLPPLPKEAKAFAQRPLLGKTVYKHAQKALEAAAGPCLTVAEDAGEGAGSNACVSFPEAVAAFEAADGKVLVAYGDMPCLQTETLAFLLAAVEGHVKAAFLQWQGEDLDQEPGLRLGGTAYCFDLRALRETLSFLQEGDGGDSPVEALTAMAEQGIAIAPVAAEAEELISVRTPLDYANALACFQERINLWHMSRGVVLLAPGATYIDADVVIGAGAVIYPGCHLEKGSKIGAECTLMPNCRLQGAVLHDQVTVENSILLECEVGSGTTVGPFAYLRPGTVVGEKCRIGDFVEIKNSHVGDMTKISHLTYVGDGDLGRNINLGCGVVFTNYDGKKKHRTAVEDDAFIGCNVNLIAPVHVGKEAYVAAGSTVTEDVPEGALYVARSRGNIKENWVQKRKEEGKL